MKARWKQDGNQAWVLSDGEGEKWEAEKRRAAIMRLTGIHRFLVWEIAKSATPKEPAFSESMRAIHILPLCLSIVAPI